MKQTIFLFLLVFCLKSTIAQIDSIRVTPIGVTEVNFIVTSSPNTTYQRTITWVNETYKNPDQVITGKVEGQSINISGYSNNAWYFNQMGRSNFYDMKYQLYITIADSVISFRITIDNFYVSSTGGIYYSNVNSFFKNNGEYRPIYNMAKPSLEATLNTLLFSYYNKINSNSLSSSEAISLLKMYKEKLDLELITQEEYNTKKAELVKYIK